MAAISEVVKELQQNTNGLYLNITVFEDIAQALIVYATTQPNALIYAHACKTFLLLCTDIVQSNSLNEKIELLMTSCMESLVIVMDK